MMDFMCGVIEGFYGSPWVFNERLDLFQRMKDLGLNTYMYGPKDDVKHRREWREKYTDVEKAMLQILIQESLANSVEFVYSISPGLDIVFSSDIDVRCLQEKLTQVQELGCRSFAILFDDIEAELCLTDKSEFRSFGEAQVVITNKVYHSLGDVKIMMICPTEYCDNRAKPNIESSEYLKTLGEGLNKDIYILWTGEKIVSQTITDQSLQLLTSVLNRKPVIWDNIHANDYDQRRLFLGPYKGRSRKLCQSVSGILTNPNCEYECNFIAFHSLSSWMKDCFLKSENKVQETFEYDSNLALEEAVKSWMELFNLKRDILYGEKISNKISFNDINSFASTLPENSVAIENYAGSGNAYASDASSPPKKVRTSLLTISDVILLCHLFYLPYEHGDSGQRMIDDFKWLKENAVDYKSAVDQYKVDEWNQRAHCFQEACSAVTDMFLKFNDIPNRRILQQLYPYIYDLKESVNMLSSFVKWLGSEKRKTTGNLFPDNPESWFFRGGITEEMQRLVPNPKDRLLKSESLCVVQTIRPYLQHDKAALYRLCHQLCDFPNAFVLYPDLPGDSDLGAFLEFSPENVYVIEVDDVIFGYGAVHEDAKSFFQRRNEKWLPSICESYKKANDPSNWSIEDEAINRLFHPQDISAHLLNNYNGLLTIKMRNKDINVARRLLKCVCSRLKPDSNVFCQLSAYQNSQYETLYKELGFYTIQLENSPTNEFFYGWKKVEVS